MKAAAESKAQEEAEHTFKPSINERSKAIFRHMINTGQPWHDRVHAGDRPGKPPGTKALTPRCEQHPFSPQISKKAQQLRRDGDVSERLHREATKGGVRGFGRDHSFTEGFVDGWFWHIVYFWGTVCGV